MSGKLTTTQETFHMCIWKWTCERMLWNEAEGIYRGMKIKKKQSLQASKSVQVFWKGKTRCKLWNRTWLVKLIVKTQTCDVKLKSSWNLSLQKTVKTFLAEESIQISLLKLYGRVSRWNWTWPVIFKCIWRYPVKAQNKISCETEHKK